MADAVKRIAEMTAKRAAKPERIVSMSVYGAVVDKAWEATMSGRLWRITEKEPKPEKRGKK